MNKTSKLKVKNYCGMTLEQKLQCHELGVVACFYNEINSMSNGFIDREYRYELKDKLSIYEIIKLFELGIFSIEKE